MRSKPVPELDVNKSAAHIETEKRARLQHNNTQRVGISSSTTAAKHCGLPMLLLIYGVLSHCGGKRKTITF